MIFVKIISTISLGLFVILTPTASAQYIDAVVPPVVDLVLNDTEFSCEFSITPISPVVGSSFNDGEQVLAQVDYQFRNAPTEFQITMFPSLLRDTDSIFQTGVTLTTSESLIIKEFDSSVVTSEGKIVVQRTNFGMSDVAFENLRLSARFSRLGRGDGSSSIEAEGQVITVGSGSIPCDTSVIFPVNWTLN